jgi:hypothetical protein
MSPLPPGSAMELQLAPDAPLQGVFGDVTFPIELPELSSPTFVDGDGAPLAHEVDSDGVRTLYWVHLPELSPGLRIEVYDNGQTQPGYAPYEVWPGAKGLWHLTKSHECSVCGPSLVTSDLDPVPGLFAGGQEVGTSYGRLELVDLPLNSITVSAWLRLRPDMQQVLFSSTQFKIERCSDENEPLEVWLKVGGQATDCLPVPPDWAFFALSVTAEGYLLVVGGEQASLPGPGLIDLTLEITRSPGAGVDELRYYDVPRTPEQLRLEEWMGRHALFVPVPPAPPPEEDTTILPGETEPQPEEVDESQGWARARWSGGCSTTPTAATGALALLALLCARRSRP